MSKLIPALLLSISGIVIAAQAHASDGWGDDHRHHHHFDAPEIDPASAISALTLLFGGLTVLRGRINKK